VVINKKWTLAANSPCFGLTEARTTSRNNLETSATVVMLAYIL
jgi:hypothetical protein